MTERPFNDLRGQAEALNFNGTTIAGATIANSHTVSRVIRPLAA